LVIIYIKYICSKERERDMPKKEVSEKHNRKKMFDLFIQVSEKILYEKYKQKA